MNETKATPGPWEVATSRDVWSAVIAPGVATICMEIENDADARLIAAAPDLLAALKWYVEHDDTDESEYYMAGQNAARAAIAKAEGGGE